MSQSDTHEFLIAALGAAPASPAADTEEAIRHLEDELRSAQEHAQAMFEELESSNEDLKSANEEYQSTNEELETSKEELQSFNEEMGTVNTELNRKVAERDHANSDLENLLNSTDLATIFLDRDLRIRAFTPAAGSVFRLLAGDAGRPITDLAFTSVDLVPDIREVLGTLTARLRQLDRADGRRFQMRVLPYRTVRNVIDGVVLTFTDVTALKEASQQSEDAKTYAENIIRTVREPLLVLDAELRVKTANETFYDVFRVSEGETLGTLLYDLGGGQWDIPELRRLLGQVLPQREALENFEVNHTFPKIGSKTMLLNARRILQQEGKKPLILLAIEDITARRQAEEALRKSHAELRAHVEELDRFNRAAVGREMRMIDLKKEVNELCQRQGEAARYPLEFEQDGADGGGALQTEESPERK